MALLENLIEMRNGGVAIDLQEGLEEVVAAVRATGKKGKLILTLNVELATKGDDMVFLSDKIVVSAPKLDKKSTIFYVNENNQLTRHDTRQMNMLDGIRDIEVTPVEPKEINSK